MPRTIDHDPREPNRNVLKLIAVITAVVTLALAVPVVFGVRWSVEQLPKAAILPLFFGAVCFLGGFYIGQWDGKRQRTPGKD